MTEIREQVLEIIKGLEAIGGSGTGPEIMAVCNPKLNIQRHTITQAQPTGLIASKKVAGSHNKIYRLTPKAKTLLTKPETLIVKPYAGPNMAPKLAGNAGRKPSAHSKKGRPPASSIQPIQPQQIAMNLSDEAEAMMDVMTSKLGGVIQKNSAYRDLLLTLGQQVADALGMVMIDKDVLAELKQQQTDN